MHLPFELARTRELMAELVDGDERNALAAQAADIYRSLGARPHLARVAERFGV
jgi:hypothetical protein